MNPVKKIILPVALLGGTAVLVYAMVMGKPTTEAREVGPLVIPVEYITATVGEHRPKISGNGTVMPAIQIDLIPEITGKVTWTSDDLRKGARFAKGDTLARLDDRDFRAAVVQEEARVQSAELEVTLEEGRRRQAEKEWEFLGSPDADSTLALRGPYLANAKANLASAEASLERARLNLSRTRLKAPFNAIVAEESMDLGQVVGPTSRAARLIGTDAFFIEVSVPVADLAHIDFPVDGRPGSSVEVEQHLSGGGVISDEAEVIELMGELDAQTRMAQVLVRLDDPFNRDDGSVPLLPGAYVDVTMYGSASGPTYEVPRSALYQGTSVWLAGAEEKLERREVHIAWGEKDMVYIDGGLSDGDRIVTTTLSMPIEGVPLSLSTKEL